MLAPVARTRTKCNIALVVQLMAPRVTDKIVAEIEKLERRGRPVEARNVRWIKSQITRSLPRPVERVRKPLVPEPICLVFYAEARVTVASMEIRIIDGRLKRSLSWSASVRKVSLQNPSQLCLT